MLRADAVPCHAAPFDLRNMGLSPCTVPVAWQLSGATCSSDPDKRRAARRSPIMMSAPPMNSPLMYTCTAGRGGRQGGVCLSSSSSTAQHSALSRCRRLGGPLCCTALKEADGSHGCAPGGRWATASTPSCLQAAGNTRWRRAQQLVDRNRRCVAGRTAQQSSPMQLHWAAALARHCLAPARLRCDGSPQGRSCTHRRLASRYTPPAPERSPLRRSSSSSTFTVTYGTLVEFRICTARLAAQEHVGLGVRTRPETEGAVTAGCCALVACAPGGTQPAHLHHSVAEAALWELLGALDECHHLVFGDELLNSGAQLGGQAGARNGGVCR